MGRGNKYHAKKVITPEGVFDSRKEYNRWCGLKLLEQSGQISQLCRQQRFTLIPEQREPDMIGPRGGVKRGKLIEKPVCYIADFLYVKDGQTVVEDCKGMRTPEYVIKRKLMLYIYGVRILET